jgi:hypothetical protein
MGHECSCWIHPPVVERPSRAGRDAFGVLWAYEEGAEGGTFPACGGHTIADLAQWRRQITVPDVDAMDFSGVAKVAAGIDRRYVLDMLEADSTPSASPIRGETEAGPPGPSH